VARGFQLGKHDAQLAALARRMGAQVPKATLAALGRYVDLAARWNEKLDLTAATEVDAQLEVLLADAFVLARPELVPEGSRCVDVGAGAGAPALPVALLRPDLDVTLVEPLRKRVAFLRTALATLGLVQRVRVLEQKLDVDHPQVTGAPFDVAWSRATFAPQEWVGLGTQLATRTLVLLATQAAPTAPEGTRADQVTEYELPRTHARRSIAVYLRT
jgi:16S rRNA (guanine527-N7)-methyltransferase